MWFYILVILLGLAFGYMRPGKESKLGLLKNGIIIGIILGIVLGLVGWLLNMSFFGTSSWLGIVWDVIILTVLFIIGVFLGDLIEGMRR